MAARRKGSELADEVVQQCFDEGITLARCKPKLLFRLQKQSAWKDIEDAYNMLHLVLRATGGERTT